jgi:hypothetical protein
MNCAYCGVWCWSEPVYNDMFCSAVCYKRHAEKTKPEIRLLRGARNRAAKSGIPFSITKDDIIIPEVCPVLGIPIVVDPRKNSQRSDSPSLDQIIPAMGYVPGNVKVISFRANSLKGDGTAEEHEAIASYIRRETAKVTSGDSRGPERMTEGDP